MNELYYANELYSKLKLNRILLTILVVVLITRSIIFRITNPPTEVWQYFTYFIAFALVVYLSSIVTLSIKRHPFPENKTKKNLITFQLKHAKDVIFESSVFFGVTLVPLFFFLFIFFIKGEKMYKFYILISDQKIYLFSGKIIILVLLFLVLRCNHMLNFSRKNLLRLMEKYPDQVQDLNQI